MIEAKDQKRKNIPGRIPIAAAATLRSMLKEYFIDLDQASKAPERKVAWLSSVGPTELLRALDFEIYYPENHGALLGATRSAAHYIPYAVSEGYSPDICSYLTSDIGAFIAGETPLTKAYGIEEIPKPDVLVFSTNQCRDVADWWGYYSREWDVPMLGVHPPHLLGEVTPDHLRAVTNEHNAMIPRLEEISGRKLDRDRLKEIVSLAHDAAVLWREILSLAQHKPSPFTFFDGVIHMAPIVLLRGTQAAVDYYMLLKDELSARVADSTAAVPGEQLRMYWEGMPVWGALRELSSLFFEKQTAVVASTYCNTWAFDKLDPENIDESMARVYTEIFINRSETTKVKVLEEFINEFSIDGIVFHDCKTCPNNTNCRYGMPERIYERLGVPSVIIGGDMTDLRLYSPDQTRTALEGFVEQLNEV
jgi:benzoyl-CoA reductase/2-hydroxyglutaryl-CoA dehydratase subunit BcrC/BadD/HgdB